MHVGFIPDCHSQIKEFDMQTTKEKSSEKTQLVYVTAVWCKPCMEKLEPIITKFRSDTAVQLTILFDKYGYEKVGDKIATLFDTTLFLMMPKKYYSDSGKNVVIKINPSKKVIRKFISEYNIVFNTSLDDKHIWFGNAIVIKKGIPYVTKSFNKEKIIAEIESQINRN
jgi:hypothetical protein